MDWSRTKTVMIIALILANLFVAYFIFFDNLNFYKDSASVEESMMNILKRERIFFEMQTRINSGTINKLQAHSIDMDLKKMLLDSKHLRVDERNYIDDYVWSVSPENSLDADYIAISDEVKKRIAEMKSQEKSTVAGFYNSDEIKDKNKVIEVAQAFMSKYLSLNFDKELLYVRRYDDLYRVYYLQKFNEFLISGGYIDVIVYHGRVLSFSQRWYDIEEIQSQLVTDDYVDIMYKLLREVKNFRTKNQFDKEITITEVEFGFGFYDDNHSLQVKYGELTPYYIFKTDDGHIIKVDAMKVD